VYIINTLDILYAYSNHYLYIAALYILHTMNFVFALCLQFICEK